MLVTANLRWFCRTLTMVVFLMVVLGSARSTKAQYAPQPQDTLKPMLKITWKIGTIENIR